MYLHPAIFILLIASVFGLSLVIIFIIQSYNHLIRKIEKADEEKAHLHDSVNQKALEILEDAHKHNVEIIEEANKEAAKILSDAQVNKTAIEAEVKDKLSSIVTLHKRTADTMNDAFEKHYREAAEKLKTHDMEELARFEGQIEDDARSQMQDFAKSLKEETVQVHEIVRERIEEEYAKAEQEIDHYKNEKMKKIEDAMGPLMKNVISLLIGRSLTPQDHEALITQAIKDASAEFPQVHKTPTAQGVTK